MSSWKSELFGIVVPKEFDDRKKPDQEFPQSLVIILSCHNK
jgi:hypothetical protein